jgi:hypothetical protein
MLIVVKIFFEGMSVGGDINGAKTQLIDGV